MNDAAVAMFEAQRKTDENLSNLATGDQGRTRDWYRDDMKKRFFEQIAHNGIIRHSFQPDVHRQDV